MIHFSRAANIAPGKIVEALTFAKTVSEYLQQKYDVKTEISMPIGGDPFRILWQSNYANLGALEDFFAKLLTDAEYIEQVTKAGSLFNAGSVKDQVWKSV